MLKHLRVPSLTVILISLILVFSSASSQSLNDRYSDLSSISSPSSLSEKGVFVIELKSKSQREILRSKKIKKFNKNESDSHDIKISREDFNKLAYTVEQEAHDLSYEHKELVAQVILNRVYHEKFPNSISGVLTQRNQFQGYINYKTKKFEPTYETILACRKVLKNNYYNNILFFYNRDIAHPKHRQFFEHNKKLTHVKTIDGHSFFAMR